METDDLLNSEHNLRLFIGLKLDQLPLQRLLCVAPKPTDLLDLCNAICPTYKAGCSQLSNFLTVTILIIS